jgi:hypothetical protein
MQKEARARIKINELLKRAGWRFFDDEDGLSNIALEEKRLLVISPFNEQTTRVTKETVFIRSRLILQLIDEIYIPYVHPGGVLEKLLNKFGENKIFNFGNQNPNLFVNLRGKWNEILSKNW